MKLNCYQLKIDGCNYKIFYASFKLTKKKPIIDTQKIKKKESKSLRKKSSNNKGRQQRRKRGTKKLQNR